jgi:DNA-binding transcriptional ArsR family regulator
MNAYETQAKLFKALMHPARLAILDILRQGEECVCHLEYLLGYRQAYISQQLSVLREAGLVQDRRDGLNIFYSAASQEVYGIIDQAARLTSTHPGKPHRLAHLKTGGGGCPCPKCSQDRALIEVASIKTASGN